MIDENISQEDLLKVLNPKRRRTRPLTAADLDAFPEPTPEAKPAAKSAAKFEPKADK